MKSNHSGIYDEEFIQSTIKTLNKAKEYGFMVFMDPHQDVVGHARSFTLDCDIEFNNENKVVVTIFWWIRCANVDALCRWVEPSNF